MPSLPAERLPSFTRIRVILLFVSIFTVIFLSEQYLQQGPLVKLDEITAHFIAMHQYEPLTLVLSAIGQLGEKFVVVILAIILSGILLRFRQYSLMIPLWISIAVTRALMSIGKNFFLRPRPDGFDDASFPSGHGSTAAVFYGFVTYLLLRTYLRRSMHLPTISATILLVALVDISRMVLEKHFLTDVIAGNALGFSILLLVIITWECLERMQTLHKKKPDSSITHACP